jgi:hypothetical protein
MNRAAPLPSPAELRALRIRERAAQVLAEAPVRDIHQLDEVLADACAAVLALETRTLRLRRTLFALEEIIEDEQPSVAGRIRELSQEIAGLCAERVQLRGLIDRLSARRRGFERARRR